MGKVPVTRIENYKPDDPLPPVFEPGGGGMFVDAVTAPVTNPVPPDLSGTSPEPETHRAMTPWEIAGMDEETWNGLEIPAFLRRTEVTLTAPSTPTSTVSPTAAAPAPAATASVGVTSGPPSSPTTVSGATGGFEHFRVDPEEIERKIKTEADVLWRNWMPTKTDRKRPRLSTYIRQVRKLYYP